MPYPKELHQPKLKKMIEKGKVTQQTVVDEGDGWWSHFVLNFTFPKALKKTGLKLFPEVGSDAKIQHTYDDKGNLIVKYEMSTASEG